MTIAALSGCAAISNPDGGAYDETPPVITGSSPQNGATNVKTKKITIEFDEFIKLENASEKVVFSPPQIEQPEIKVVGKKIQVELFDSLRENTTYSIDFADGIVDNNEGNPLGDYCFRFSTGPDIDTLEVSGYVLNASDLEPVKGITVGLHSDLSDSAFMTKPFERVSRTDGSGHFTVRGIAPGKYRIYAVMDMDQTFSYSQRNEKIAWLDTIIVPTSELNYREDTIFNPDLTVDTTAIVPFTRFMPDNITLLAFTPEPVIQYMSGYERPSHRQFTLRFALPVDSMPVIKGLNFDEKDAYVLQHSIRYDTLTFWMKDSTVFYMDTLEISVTYPATDTLMQLVPVTDTLKLVPKVSRAKIIKDAQRKAENDKKELDRQIRRLERTGDTVAILNLLKPKMEFLDINVTSGGSLSIWKQITLDVPEPVTFLSDTAIHVYQKVDTVLVPIPFEIEHDTINILRYRIYGEWKPEETYKIEIDSASIQGLYGLHNNRIESTLKFNELSRYSRLIVNVWDPKPGYIVSLLDSKGNVKRRAAVENGSADFYLLDPGNYYVSMFYDRNGNGQWDTGDYEEKRQPEEIWFIKRVWNLKQDWVHETEPWSVHETPVYDQKPAELIKEKSARKTIDVHKKNLERIQKKSSQIEAEKKKKERQRLERQERRRKNKEKYDAIRARVKAVKRAQKEMKKASKENSEAVIEDPVIQESSEAAVSSPDVEEVTTPNE